jgi:nucleotide-binding universal stress UspA family protein
LTRNFAERGEVGAAVAAYWRGEKVVDLWGGHRTPTGHEPWEEDTMVLVNSTTKGLAAMIIAVASSRCEAAGADLLVVGSSRRGLLSRVLIGNDTRSALNGAPCAIAMAPAGYSRQSGPMLEIGVSFDGSPESRHALEVASCLATESGANLSAFEAVSIPTYAFVGGAISIDDTPELLVKGVRRRIAEPGDVEPHAGYDPPVDELALYSASLDLLVVGSRGYGPIGRLIHGSTPAQLAQAARCPLLVLTRKARTASGANHGEDHDLARTPEA